MQILCHIKLLTLHGNVTYKVININIISENNEKQQSNILNDMALEGLELIHIINNICISP